MKFIADFCIVPMGTESPVSQYVAKCQGVLHAHDLKVVLHANGTNIEGELSGISKAIEACYKALFAMGVSRAYTTLNMSSRIDKDQSMEDKIASVNALQLKS